MEREHILKIYERADGGCQVRDYLRAQEKAVSAEAGWLLTRLQAEGSRLGRPSAAILEDGIYELRVIVGRRQHRILFFFHHSTIVATNAFLKKTRRVPKEEIEKAKQIRKDWLRREETT